MGRILATRHLDDGRLIEAHFLARLTVYGITFTTPTPGDDDIPELVTNWITNNGWFRHTDDDELYAAAEAMLDDALKRAFWKRLHVTMKAELPQLHATTADGLGTREENDQLRHVGMVVLLAEAHLGRHDPEVAKVIEKLWPEWTGEPEELANAAESWGE